PQQFGMRRCGRCDASPWPRRANHIGEERGNILSWEASSELLPIHRNRPDLDIALPQHVFQRFETFWGWDGIHSRGRPFSRNASGGCPYFSPASPVDAESCQTTCMASMCQSIQKRVRCRVAALSRRAQHGDDGGKKNEEVLRP